MLARRQPFEIGGVRIAPGSRDTLSLSLPGQAPYAPMSVPVHVIHGRRDGPVLFLSAAIHGDEINGIEIIRRIRHTKALNRLRGTLVCVPIVNVYGFINHTRYLPDRRDLNRSFPGSENGSLAGRLARLFASEVVDRCTHGIDLHTGANHRVNLPHVRADLDHPESARLARAFGAPVIVDASLRDGSLREYGMERGLPMLLYEAGEGLRFDALSIRGGVRGILNVMRELGMIAGKSVRSRENQVESRSSQWVRAPVSGLLRVEVPMGARVGAGQRLARLADAIGDNEVEVKSPTAGIIIGRTNNPVVNGGDALFHIASVENGAHAERAIEQFQGLHIEGLGDGDFADPGVI
ncbi:MAG: succinylglutamate desuccinylase/aspartoacylase family protein [Halieaceae bacterium]|nr:succinylglutamate desuccinylase/aspartoacylase family protein [Halieaceae bacterium]